MPSAFRKQAISERAHNQARIRQLAMQAPTDLEALALLFEDDGIVDDGTVAGRLGALLRATERRIMPGLQTAIPFGDTGFAGERRPGGAGLRDPWPASRNQVGHFLTAVGLQVAPEVVSRPLPVLGSIRHILGAPAAMSDSEVALRLTIGHEKVPDPPNVLEASLLILAQGFGAARWTVARDGTVTERVRRIVAALMAEACHQAVDSFVTYRAQFHATTEDDIAAWQEALRVSGKGRAFAWQPLEGASSPLRAIAVGNGEGNSMQDLRLSLVGWRLGQLIGCGAFNRRQDVAAWIRRTLG
ncbi:MAG TPA: hypothetical protein VKF37_02540 [Chloroflexota bacterium]|nr:hypothetical protein [Chloroflexota bacterium]